MFMRPQSKSAIKVTKLRVPPPRASGRISPPSQDRWRPAKATTLAELAFSGGITIGHVRAAIERGMSIKSFKKAFWDILCNKDDITEKDFKTFQQFQEILV